jgi:hypothetical protein
VARCDQEVFVLSSKQVIFVMPKVCAVKPAGLDDDSWVQFGSDHNVYRGRSEQEDQVEGDSVHGGSVA